MSTKNQEAKLERAAFAAIDALNARDPRRVFAEGREWGREELYGVRMSSTLASFAAAPPLALRLAVRAQHLERWVIARETFEEGRAGYHRWRNAAQTHHAAKLRELLHSPELQALGADDALIEEAAALVRKRGPLAQTLEDVACLVFLEHELREFAQTVSEEKLHAILKKTWSKMSDAAHAAAPAPIRTWDLDALLAR